MHMKNWLTICFCLLGFYGLAQTGYEIKVTFKPYKNQYIYLGHYFGKTYPIIDSVKLDNNSTGVFKGNKLLQGGIYLIGYPNRSGFFEILLDKQQRFSVIADSATAPAGIQFMGSPDNELFNTYQRSMGEKGAQINIVRESLKNASATDSVRINQELIRLDQELRVYREKMITEHPNTILSALLMAMKEPVLPANLQKPATREDSVAAFRYYKEHYWEGVNFWDGRLAYTTFFEDKLDRYFTQLVVPHPDSVNKEMDYMLSFAKANAEMERFLLLRFVNRYYSQKYMWEDAVFVHLYEKYFSKNPPSWLSEQGKKMITDRAYSLMANLLGNKASEIFLPNTSGKIQSLYGVNSKFLLLVFWDPTCGHCKETLPIVDSFYNKRWKSMGVKIYSVAKETSGDINSWYQFISENNLQDWVNVYYSKDQEKSLVEANIPGYAQLYDVSSFPTIYLLDSEKRIKAKKLSPDQIDELLRTMDSVGYTKASPFKKEQIATSRKIIKEKPALGLSNEYYNSSGSGLLVDPQNGLVITNFHVVKDASVISLKFFVERQSKPIEVFGEVFKFDEFNDIALIKINEKLPFSVIPFKVLKSQDSVARRVYALGYPRLSIMGDELKVTEGIISSLSGYLSDSRYYQVSAAIAPGNSGGPLFSENGDLLGINSSGFVEKSIAENVGYSLKSTNIINFLTNNGISITQAQGGNDVRKKSPISMLNDYSKYVPLIRVKQ